MRPQWWAEKIKAKPIKINPTLLRFFTITKIAVKLFHRPKVEGLEQLKRDEPYLLVANHSAGIALSEITTFAIYYLTELGSERPIAALAHPFGFFIWPISYFLRGIGAIPSTSEAAESALRSGIPLLVFPGGDYEASRPFWCKEVDFNNRRGFLRIAKRTNTPIIPMGISGSHYTAPVLWRSQWLLPRLYIGPKIFGLKRYPLTLLAIIGVSLILSLCPSQIGWTWSIVLAYLWMASPFTLLPWVPSKIRICIGEPIEPSILFKEGDQDLKQAYQVVVGFVQELVDKPS